MTSHRPTIRVEDGNASQSDDEGCDTLLFFTPPQSPSPNPDQEHSPFLAGDRAAASTIPAGPEHVNNIANPSTEHRKVVAKAGSLSTTERPASEFQRQESVSAGKKLPSSSSPEHLYVADVSSDQSQLSSPTPEKSAFVSNPSAFVRMTELETPTKKRRNKKHLSLAIDTNLFSSGQSLRLSPLSETHREPGHGGLPGKDRKSVKGKRAQTSGKKTRCSEDGNESTTATSSVESVSKQPKSIINKNSFRHRFRSSMSFLRKKVKSAPSTDYRESSDSSVFWNTRSGTQINSCELANGISPDHFVGTVTLHESSLDDGAQVLSQLVLPQGQ